MTYRSLGIVSALLHLFVALRLVSGLDGHQAAQLALAVALAVSAVLLPLGMAGRRGVRQPWADRLSWTGFVLMGFFSSLVLLTLLRDALLILLRLVDALRTEPLAMSGMTSARSVVMVLVTALGVTLLGFRIARRTASVRRLDVPLEGLDIALHGFTVVQISDIHVGPTIKRDYLQRIVNKVNTLHADVVAVTGDLVDGSVSELAGHVAPLAALKSRHGTFFVTGNHEYYAGAHAWIRELRRLGLTVLINEHVVLHHSPATQVNDQQSSAQGDSQLMAALLLAGVTDYSAHHFEPAHRSDPKLALEGAPESVRTRVLLAHQPRSAQAAAEAGFDLQVSGHTHGGQFFPWNFFVRLQQPYTAGLHRWQNMWVYTSRGTGYWGPPNRFGSPSEITVLRLVRG
ncbi:MAG: metallophosphoesterase [Polaromonas sp.]|jgi:predicted MPP superfamily phosphohydrolase|nr:metallophosphoesterase [Polaromonas sp.]